MAHNNQTYNNNWINSSAEVNDQPQKQDIDQVSYESKDHNKNIF